MYADGAYDAKACHELIRRKGATACIPPRKNVCLWEEGHPRNDAVLVMRKEGSPTGTDPVPARRQAGGADSHRLVPKWNIPPGEKPTYRSAWQHGKLCLVPMLGFFEPCYESGKAERWRIGMAYGKPFAVAGIWRAWQEEQGYTFSFSQLTVNADHWSLFDAD